MSPFLLNVINAHPRQIDHEHAWRTESMHSTSEGQVVYVRCATCGAHRVDLQPIGMLIPGAVSRPVRTTQND